MSPHYVVFVKVNTANKTVVVMRQDSNGNKEVLTRHGEWIEWSPKAETILQETKIYDVFFYHPTGSPPD